MPAMAARALPLVVLIATALVALPLAPAAAQSGDPNPADQATLLLLKQQWGGQFLGAASWKAGGSWDGVLVDTKGFVVELQLARAGLTGSVTGTVSRLSKLQVLNLRDNRLAGVVNGGTFGAMRSIYAVLLAGNQLIGRIPPDMFTAPLISSIDLSRNQFTGEIPTNVSSAKGLRSLDLSSNKLRGAIPGQILSCSSLMWLQLQNNNLSGIVPGKLYALKKLQVVDLSRNKLSGGIPVGLWSLGDLMFLDLSANQLSGAVPSDVSKLQDLQKLSLAQNFLTGTIPSLAGLLQPCKPGDSTCYFSQTQIDLSGNFLVGPPTMGFSVSQGRGKASLSYSVCLPSALPAQVNLGGNCLDPALTSSSTSPCRSPVQKPQLSCVAFCGSSSPLGQCGGGGWCGPWLTGPRNRPPFTCHCRSGWTYPKTATGAANMTTCVPASS